MYPQTNNLSRSLSVVLFFIFFTASKCFSQNPFITVWKTDNAGGATATNQIRVPATGSYTYTWEKVGTPATNGSGSGTGELNLTFATAGSYRLRMTPTGVSPFSRIAFTTATSDAPKLTNVEQWGDVVWSSMQSAFANASNLVSITAADVPNLTSVTSMRDMFRWCYLLSSVNNINSWNTSSVTDMTRVFNEAYAFNSNIGNWSVGNVTTMNQMFGGASVFNQNIGSWDVRKVQDMSLMFQYANAFNQNIGSWQVRDATNMTSMFQSALNFNQDISSWDVNGVLTMDYMFNAARKFNQPIGSWNVSTVTNMSNMFFNADVFNNPLNSWNVGSVTNMSSMFGSADVFDQNLGSWNLTSVTNVTNMFFLTALSCNNYSNTLVGWAAKPATPNDLNLSNNTLFAGGAIKYGTAAVSARNTLTATVVSGGKGWTISGDSYDASCIVLLIPVPVKLLYFAAVKENTKILLEWATVTEINNNGFEVERSADGINWNKIAFVATQAINGNSTSDITYTFTDNMPYSTVGHYRLKQIDIDGKYEYSMVRMVDLGNSVNMVRFYPNPVKDALVIEGITNATKIEVVNSTGQIVKSRTAFATVTTIDLSSLSNGVYFMRIIDKKDKVTVQKIIKE